MGIWKRIFGKNDTIVEKKSKDDVDLEIEYIKKEIKKAQLQVELQHYRNELDEIMPEEEEIDMMSPDYLMNSLISKIMPQVQQGLMPSSSPLPSSQLVLSPEQIDDFLKNMSPETLKYIKKMDDNQIKEIIMQQLPQGTNLNQQSLALCIEKIRKV